MKKFALLTILYLALQVVVDTMLLSDDLIYESFISQLNYDRITEMLEQKNKWRLLVYLPIPFFLFIRILFVSICLSIGAFFLRIEHRLGKYFAIANDAEFIFLIPAFIRVLWFTIFSTRYTLSDLQYFYPLSLLNFFSVTEVEAWFVYPLQILNVFELVYWLVLAYLLKDDLGKGFFGSLGFVAATYGVGLIIWVAIIVFLTLNLY